MSIKVELEFVLKASIPLEEWDTLKKVAKGDSNKVIEGLSDAIGETLNESNNGTLLDIFTVIPKEGEYHGDN